MKFDWSKILIAVMAAFIIFIVSMGIKMATTSQALYEDNYYEQGELHDARMEQERVGKQVKVEYNRANNALDVGFVKQGYVTGYKLVYLADNSFDFYEKMLAATSVKEQPLPLPNSLKAGMWVLEISGYTEGKVFFKKQQFVK